MQGSGKFRSCGDEVLNSYDARKESAIANALVVLGISDKEDVISNLLRYGLETSQAFRDAFLQGICGIDLSAVTHVRALTRISTSSAGIPDLLIAAEGSREKYLVVLENKLKAEEGKDQTDRYSSTECVRDLKARVGWSKASVAESFVFLSLFPDQEPNNKRFRRVTYNDFWMSLGISPHLVIYLVNCC